MPVVHRGDNVGVNDPAATQSVGLCATCQNARRVVSDRGSVFFLCKLSATDSRFPKYPRLPMVSCVGYQAEQPDEQRPCK